MVAVLAPLFRWKDAITIGPWLQVSIKPSVGTSPAQSSSKPFGSGPEKQKPPENLKQSSGSWRYYQVPFLFLFGKGALDVGESFDVGIRR